MKVYIKKHGFTLIELVVVIAIIGILSTIVIGGLSGAKSKGRDNQRVSDLKNIEIALKLYYFDNNQYPNTANAWRSQCPAWGSYAADQVAPGLVPAYLQKFPADPLMQSGSNNNCYLYRSNANGSSYKILLHNLTETDITSQPKLIDPRRNKNHWDNIEGGSPCSNQQPPINPGAAITWASFSSSVSQCW